MNVSKVAMSPTCLEKIINKRYQKLHWQKSTNIF